MNNENEIQNKDRDMRYGHGRSFWVMKVIKIILIVAIAGTVMSYLVMMLWNWLMPVIFNATAINFWQALGILVLAKLIFGFSRGWSGGHWGHRHQYWKSKMEDRLKNMSPEDRDRFREEWKRRCGGWKHYNWGEQKKEGDEVKA
jgi:hypothetical protein